jgi:hypothetical protein
MVAGITSGFRQRASVCAADFPTTLQRGSNVERPLLLGQYLAPTSAIAGSYAQMF